jgi:hypothetical protein
MDLKAVGISILQRQAADDTRSAKACGSGLKMFVLLQHFQFRDNSLTVAYTVVGNGEDQRTGIIPGHRQLNVEGILHGWGNAVLDGVFHQGLQDQIWDQTILQFLGTIYGKFQRNGGDHIGKLNIFRSQADLFRNGILLLIVIAQIPPQIPAGIDGKLLHFLDTAAGKSYRLNPGRPVSMGRTPGQCGLAMPSCNKVSSRHCTLELRGSTILLTDLASTNGTYIDSRRIQPNVPATVASGSVISLGNQNCSFRIFLQ